LRIDRGRRPPQGDDGALQGGNQGELAMDREIDRLARRLAGVTGRRTLVATIGRGTSIKAGFAAAGGVAARPE
jgi:hypothetical protein